MAQYDSSLFYTLKPGKFTFTNSEFSTPFHVNSIGCRDDEESIEHPKIIMIGDSYGMGWGVNQNDTYANLVEKELHQRVLNMSISSYGTPREIKFLERVNTDSLNYLIIQYCPNAYGEIIQHHLHDNQLVVSNKYVYDSISALETQNKSYYPFKRTKELLPLLLGKEKTAIVDTNHYPELPAINFSKSFLDIIRNSKNLPKHSRIIVFMIGVKGYSNTFMENVQSTLEKEFSSSLHDQITFVNFSNVLTDNNYFVLDPHINSSGHRLIADSLIKYIQKSPTGVSEKKWHHNNGNTCIHANYFSHYKEGITTYY